jgi:hypothetical protein
MKRRLVLIASLIVLHQPTAPAESSPLEQGWTNPPASARVRAYWWWLNGNVTPAALTRDLEEMKAKGWGGALICDAGGAEQDGNAPVNHGPTFFTAEWRQLYKHALREAARLGLEMSLNIQSGWNLGGPMVTAEDAAKKLVWSEARVSGPASFAQRLPEPPRRDGLYRDLFVVAYPRSGLVSTNALLRGVTASSEQAGHPAGDLADGTPNTFWVSGGTQPGDGPTRQKPAWVRFDFTRPVGVDRCTIEPRPGYGPREVELQVADDGQSFRSVKRFAPAETGPTAGDFASVTGRVFRCVIFAAFDPRFPDAPRNVQIAEFSLSGPDGAWPEFAAARRRPIQNWQEKALHRALHFSAPDTTPLLVDLPPEPGEEDARADEVLDLTPHLAGDGTLRWDVPAGDWEILRFGCTVGDRAKVSTSSDGWKGFALDVLDDGAFRRYWDAVVEPLLADAGPLAGKTLKYLHTDSWEVDAINWTPTLREEFRRRRGYDLLPFLPVLAGRIVNSRDESNRVLHDFRKTLGDLAIDNHYRLFRDGARRHGLEIHPESGGPHAVPIDAQHCLGFNDVPMSEFWAWSWRHRVGDSNRFFVKQPASAAHTHGRRLVAAEGFTTIGPHWQETLWDNLKPSFDHALCEGLNLLFWHAFVCSPEEEGLPGIQYFAGTHFNPNTTWWPRSGPFIAYLNRCQWLLQQGLFVADACYYYGDHVPNFAQLRRSDPAGVLPGYDYDVLTEETLLHRLSAQAGRLVLPDGMSYRVLALPKRAAISLPVLRRLKELVEAGATVVGPRPATATGWLDHARADAEVQRLAEALWGAGRVVAHRPAREVLRAAGVPPDFEFAGPDAHTALDYIHRRDGEAEIYFVANRSNRAETVRCQFRVAGKAPELWDPVTGQRRFAAAYSEVGGRTTVPLEFPPFGSWFVVFREPAAAHPATSAGNFPRFEPRGELAGPWTAHFPVGMSAAERNDREMQMSHTRAVVFDPLQSWTGHTNAGIKFYSGAATYTKTFDLPASLRPGRGRVWLDLGSVRELAGVRLNGHDLGIVWTPPFRVDITDAMQPAGNSLLVEVINFWPNRIIGDQSLPPEQRFTRTNIRKLTRDTPLMESGLLGPVKLLESVPAEGPK